MLTPPRSRPPLLIHNPMTGQQLRPRRIPERPANHPGMARPPRQGRNITICSHLPARNLAHNIQYLRLKHPSLLNRHSIRIILHLSKNAPLGTVPFGLFVKGADKYKAYQSALMQRHGCGSCLRSLLWKFLRTSHPLIPVLTVGSSTHLILRFSSSAPNGA